jgi:hypothetical protein
MPQTSLLGPASPKQRTINVEVNLLAEWNERRQRLRDERLRWSGFLATVVLVGVVAVPMLGNLAAQQQARAKRALAVEESKRKAYLALAAKRDLVQPKLDGDATLQLCRARSKALMGHMLDVLNRCTPQLAAESLDAAVLGGELTLRLKAQAETYPAAQEYVADASGGKGVLSAILATARINPSLGPDGVTFEFAKKIEVGK